MPGILGVHWLGNVLLAARLQALHSPALSPMHAGHVSGAASGSGRGDAENRRIKVPRPARRSQSLLQI